MRPLGYVSCHHHRFSHQGGLGCTVQLAMASRPLRGAGCHSENGLGPLIARQSREESESSRNRQEETSMLGISETQLGSPRQGRGLLRGRLSTRTRNPRQDKTGCWLAQTVSQTAQIAQTAQTVLLLCGVRTPPGRPLGIRPLPSGGSYPRSARAQQEDGELTGT